MVQDPPWARLAQPQAINNINLHFLFYSFYLTHRFYYSNKQILQFNPLSELVGGIRFYLNTYEFIKQMA